MALLAPTRRKFHCANDSANAAGQIFQLWSTVKAFWAGHVLKNYLSWPFHRAHLSYLRPRRVVTQRRKMPLRRLIRLAMRRCSRIDRCTFKQKTHTHTRNTQRVLHTHTRSRHRCILIPIITTHCTFIESIPSKPLFLG